MSKRLFVNVSGGAKLAIDMKRRLEEGENKLTVRDLGPDTDFGSIDVVEKGKTSFGSLDLLKVTMPRDSRGRLSTTKNGANLVVRAAQAGSAEFSVQADVGVGVQIRHRLVIAEDGRAELSSKAMLENHGKTSIKDAKLTITAGDNQNQYGGVRKYARAALESAADTSVSAAGSTVYRFDLPDLVSLAKGEKLPVNLFNKDLPVAKVEKTLDLATSGSYWGLDARSRKAGSVQTTYTVANTEANGMGVILPAGSVEIKRPDGLLLSKVNIGDTSNGDDLVLNGGTAFDLDATRKQTSWETQGQGRAGGGRPVGRGERRLENVKTGQEITLCSKSDRPESVNITESLPQSAEGEVKVSNVKVNGQALPEAGYSIDAENNALVISGVAIPAKGETKVSFDVAFVQEFYN
jgi:hypothetical protein